MPECEVFPSFSSSCLSFERKKKRRLTGTGIPLMQEINQVQCELLISRRYHTDKLVRKRKRTIYHFRHMDGLLSFPTSYIHICQGHANQTTKTFITTYIPRGSS